MIADALARELFYSLLSDEARSLGYAVTSASSTEARIHLMHQLFFALAKNIDWFDIADRFVRVTLREASIEAPEGPLDGVAVAKLNGITEPQLMTLLARRLRATIVENPHITALFKPVIQALCSAVLEPKGISRSRGLAVVDWLRGEPADREILRTLHIGRRINRRNARALLVDVARWVRMADLTGLVCLIDASRYCDSEPSFGQRYGVAAALDLCEMIRQFIDGADNSDSLLLVFTSLPRFLSDERRGLSAYPALKMRLIDDVYDSKRPNLSSPLMVC